MYPVVNVVVGWLAAALKGRVLIMASVLCATTVAAAILTFEIAKFMSRGNSGGDASGLLPPIPFLAIAATTAMGTAPTVKIGWPWQTAQRSFDGQRIIGGTILFLVAAIAGVAGFAQLSTTASLALLWTVTLIAVPTVIGCAWATIVAHRQRAALQREAKQD
jgi:hypothetical protein